MDILVFVMTTLSKFIYSMIHSVNLCEGNNVLEMVLIHDPFNYFHYYVQFYNHSLILRWSKVISNSVSGSSFEV